MNNHNVYIKEADWEALERVRLYLIGKGNKCPSRSAALAWLIRNADDRISTAPSQEKKSPQ